MNKFRKNVATFRETELLQNCSSEMIDNMHIVRSAYRSVMANNLTYVSMPITSGERFYDVLESYGVMDSAKLPDGVLYNEIILPNIEKYTGIAQGIQDENPNRTVIAPSVFEAKKQRWSQEEYMYLWYWVLQDKISTGILADKFSNGGSEEAVCMNEIRHQMTKVEGHHSSGLPRYIPTIALERGGYDGFESIGDDMTLYPQPSVFDLDGTKMAASDPDYLRSGNGMEIFDLDGEAISIDENAAIIRRSVENLRERGFKTGRLESCLLDLGGIAHANHMATNYLWGKESEPDRIWRGRIYDEIAKVIGGDRFDVDSVNW
ncbi:hypothetical protein HN903_01960 [archaeon]|jgi:hypothetical protein|nr:hypothetical protein [archaeon]MBT7128498.1 hypothetical protein [archaeon]